MYPVGGLIVVIIELSETRAAAKGRRSAAGKQLVCLSFLSRYLVLWLSFSFPDVQIRKINERKFGIRK